jgi:hypothetical protein
MHSRTLRAVLRSAHSVLHSFQNRHIHDQNAGSRLGRKRSAWSLRHSDLTRIMGAAGDDQAWLCPGANSPALA